MSNSFTNQSMAPWQNATKSKDELTGISFATGNIYVLPKKLDEKLARLHLKKVGVKLTTLTKTRADYLGIAVDGPFKPENYRC